MTSHATYCNGLTPLITFTARTRAGELLSGAARLSQVDRVLLFAANNAGTDFRHHPPHRQIGIFGPPEAAEPLALRASASRPNPGVLCTGHARFSSPRLLRSPLSALPVIRVDNCTIARTYAPSASGFTRRVVAYHRQTSVLRGTVARLTRASPKIANAFETDFARRYRLASLESDSWEPGLISGLRPIIKTRLPSMTACQPNHGWEVTIVSAD
jgi:hypothetical protein